jgi:hypothetical protein
LTALVLCAAASVRAEGPSTPGGKARAQPPPAVHGLERARLRADGAQEIRDRVSGHGKVAGHRQRVYSGIVAPGDSPGCISDAGNVTFSASATLVIEIGGATPCLQHDRFSVGLKLNLQGPRLRLLLIDGFVPVVGQRFDILDWGSLSGMFGNLDTSGATLPAGMSWDFGGLHTSGEVVVTAAPAPLPAQVPLPPWAYATLGGLLPAIAALSRSPLRRDRCI